MTAPETIPMFKKRRKPLIRSIARRTAMNYLLYSVVVLVLFWVALYVLMNSFFGALIERDLEEGKNRAAEAFPKRIDDNSVKYYKMNLSKVARDRRPMIFVLFTRDENNKNKVIFTVDDVIGDSNTKSELFDAIMSDLSFDNVFSSGGTDKVSTSLGSYLCVGSVHKVSTADGGMQTGYLLVIKPNEIFDAHTMKIIYAILICTGIVLVFSFVFSQFASRYQTKRLKDFSQKAKRLAAGDYSVEFSGYGYDEYENLAGVLNAATANIQKTEKMQRDIVANVSHDIRTPLTIIKSYTEMLRDMPMDEAKRQKTANVVIAEVDRLSALTSDILDFSRLQSGAAAFNFEKCNISKVAETVLEQLDIVRERDGFKLLSDIDPDVFVNCDEKMIDRVLYNFLLNAVNYSGEDKTVILGVKRRETTAYISITDHGRGIAEQDLEAVWERYYRVQHSGRPIVGSGLGLSICKNILSAHGAQYGVQSELGKGSTFWFELPMV